jgi:uncharacterized protein (DUF362 family)
MATGAMLIAPHMISLSDHCRADDGIKDSGEVLNWKRLRAGEVLFGLSNRDPNQESSKWVEKVLHDSIDFSWLKPGESVLIKIASNSKYPHPSTTSPQAVYGMAHYLIKKLGAENVYIADQAGVESVRSTAYGVLLPPGSSLTTTSQLVIENGIGQSISDSGAVGHFFDDQDYFTDWSPATLPNDSAWIEPFLLPNILQQVDHIIYLPRMAFHGLSGYSLAHKMAVGFLREDDRFRLHNEATNFYEKVTDINYAHEITDKLRLVLTLSEKVLLHQGPDFGTIYEMEQPLIIASDSLPNHDAVALSLMMYLSTLMTPQPVPIPGLPPVYISGYVDLINTTFIKLINQPWEDQGFPWLKWGGMTPPSYQPIITDPPLDPNPFNLGVTNDRILQRAWSLTGGQPESITIKIMGLQPDQTVLDAIYAHGQGLYEFTGESLRYKKLMVYLDS